MTEIHMSFDTLSYSKKLRAAGFTELQAEVQAETLQSILEEQMATKRDLREMEMRLLLKLGAMAAGCVTLTVSLVKLLS
ncbi:MAG: hypothetical protein U0T73_09490 [Chitinophagales bacterium]